MATLTLTTSAGHSRTFSDLRGESIAGIIQDADSSDALLSAGDDAPDAVRRLHIDYGTATSNVDWSRDGLSTVDGPADDDL